MRIEMGQKVRDKITGFAGTVTGHARYITGCDQFLVLPMMPDDKTVVEGRWFDEKRLDVTDTKTIVLDDEKQNGADMPAPIK
jgi:hypothetical protein